jgi:hypothetical protein
MRLHRTGVAIQIVLCEILVTAVCVFCQPQVSALPAPCQLSGHCFGIIHELAEPFVVRSAGGDVRISSTRPDDPLRGATVEVFGPNGSTVKHSTETDARGGFKIKGLKAGTYRFHVWASGFNSVVGRLVISKDTDQGNKLHIELTLGV